MDILIVDNDNSVLNSIKKALERAGYNCIIHNNLNNLSNIYKSNNFKVLIVDLFIGINNCFDFINEIIAYDKNAKIIIITGHERSEINQIEDKIFGFFQKPINLFDLIATLKKLEN